MKIRDLKAVIVDDAAVKSIHIKRALQFCGVENIVILTTEGLYGNIWRQAKRI